jgi:hypothetical protein
MNILSIAFTILVYLASTSALASAQQYSVTDLGTLGGDTSIASGIGTPCASRR